MAEQEKNYLDLESTAAQVKKSIEEIVEKLTENVVENKDKIFTLEVDTGNISENFDGMLTDDMLDKVKIRLKTVNEITSNSIQTTEIGDGTELVLEYLPKNNVEYRFTTGTVKSIIFNNLTEEGGLSNDYWVLFIFMRDSSTSFINDIILNEDIKILNTDLDISAYTILHLLFTYDGFNICCKVAGY